MTEEIEIYLNHIRSVCPELTENELKKFSEKLTITKIHKNDFYIKAGELQKQGGFLVKGLIRAFHTDSFGNEKNIYFIPENEYTFHYASFVNNKPSPLSFQCLETSTIINFPTEHLQNAYDEISKFEKYGRLIVETKLKLQQQRLESFLYQNAEQRYINFINQYPQLFNRISITQLCSYLGVERQTLTRIRKKLSQSQ
ncbi:Crp/Fnr family transcriptional regulator [Flavobacterium sp. I3-2]|uniref:Crp/Fnr family transcriptional regulator n=1 Tax=Flavobacterium sp. I3-2 TaxID=2748319 RepID=UPI0015ABC1E8|nr:Crp/Fnr family transcriptional regulator [Flavobacterium sp. I3-2]